MTTSSQAPLGLPPTFIASFWPSAPSHPSYRSSTTHLYTLLQHGIDENASILIYVKHLVDAQWALVDSLRASTEGITAQVARDKPLFKGARGAGSTGTSTSARNSTDANSTAAAAAATHAHAPPPTPGTHLVAALHHAAVDPLVASHVRTAKHLQRHILEPFAEWREQHAQRVQASWNAVEQWLTAYEDGQDELDRLRHNYELKCRQADEAEDDARFSGIDVDAVDPVEAVHSGGENGQHADAAHTRTPLQSEPAPTLTASPQMVTDSLADEQPPTKDGSSVAGGDDDGMDPVKLERRRTLRKQFGFTPRTSSGTGTLDGGRKTSLSAASAASAAPTSLDPQQSPQQSQPATITSALSSALSAPALQSIRERIAAAAGAGGIGDKWRRLRRDADRLEREYITSARSLDSLRCRLEDLVTEHFGALQKYELERLTAVRTAIKAYSNAFAALHPTLSTRVQPLVLNHDPHHLLSRLITSARTGFYRPQPEVFHPFYHDEGGVDTGSSLTSPALSYATGWAGFGMNLNVRWRAEVLAKGELDGAANIAADAASASAPAPPPVSLPLVLSHLLTSLERAYAQPALWPVPSSPSPASSDATLVAAHAEKRKVWIYDVPLSSAHTCRAAIINHTLSSSHPGAELGAGLPALLDRFDPPTKAMALKVWLAELQEGLVPEENWHLVSSLYKAAESVEAKWRRQRAERKEGKAKAGDGETGEQSEVEQGDAQRGDAQEQASQKTTSPTQPLELDDTVKGEIKRGVLEDLGVVLGRLSSVHLVVLDTLLVHLRALIAATRSPASTEPDSVYINKLALALGRFVLRPPSTTHSTLASPVPTLLLIDLITHYDELLPPALQRKNRAQEEVLSAKRRMPTRKRTKPVDARIRRSQIGVGGAGVPPLPAKTPQQPPAAPPKIETDREVLTGQVEMRSPEQTTAPVAPTPIEERVLARQVPAPAEETQPQAAKSPDAGADAGADADAGAGADAGADAGASSPSPSQAQASARQRISKEYEDFTVSKPSSSPLVGEEELLSPVGAAPSEPKVTSSGSSAAPRDSPSTSSVSSPTYASPAGSHSHSNRTSYEYDEDKPLSNVARLSRQFGSGGSGSGSGSSAGAGLSRAGAGGGSRTSVRGPRPAGGRASNASGASVASEGGSAGAAGGAGTRGVAALASKLEGKR